MVNIHLVLYTSPPPQPESLTTTNSRDEHTAEAAGGERRKQEESAIQFFFPIMQFQINIKRNPHHFLQSDKNIFPLIWKQKD